MSLELVSKAFRGCPVSYVQYVYNGHYYQTGPEDVRKETGIYRMGATLSQKSMQCFYTSAVKLKDTTAQGPGPKGLVFRNDACVCVNPHVNKVN